MDEQFDDENSHRHKCNNCSFVWRHHNRMFGTTEAHTCGRCGREQWWKYEGDDKEDFIGCGRPVDPARVAEAVN